MPNCQPQLTFPQQEKHIQCCYILGCNNGAHKHFTKRKIIYNTAILLAVSPEEWTFQEKHIQHCYILGHNNGAYEHFTKRKIMYNTAILLVILLTGNELFNTQWCYLFTMKASSLRSSHLQDCFSEFGKEVVNNDVICLIGLPRWTGDEPPHQIRSYTLLFSLFLYFPYVADPPLRTSALTWPRSRSHDNRTRSIGPISLIWWTYDLRFTCIYFYS